jgi:hypothetical protein
MPPPGARRRLIAAVRDPALRLLLALPIRRKWQQDRDRLPLAPEHFELYRNIHESCWRFLRRFPNLVVPRTRNDAIHWMKLFDPHPESVRCCDKVRVRDVIAERAGPLHVVPLYQVHQQFDEIDFGTLPGAFAIKTNHDSSGAILVRDLAQFDRTAARARVTRSLARRHGWDFGEWAYAWVERRVLVEELLDPTHDRPPPDYKFVCEGGRVAWCAFITSDDEGQCIERIGRDGTVLPPEEENGWFRPGHSFVRPTLWDEMVRVAEAIAHDFRMVRVDIYCTAGRVLVGEVTLWSYGGFATDPRWNAPCDFGGIRFDDPRPLVLPPGPPWGGGRG